MNGQGPNSGAGGNSGGSAGAATGNAGPYSHISITEFPAAPQYYFELRHFLEHHQDRNQQSLSQQRQNARDKLTRLSKLQFQELSTDVYDEMSRRQSNNPEIPFLPVRDDFHPKRNQARQKLATLPKNRFKDLAADVFFELEVRFPVLLEVSKRIEAAADHEQEVQRQFMQDQQQIQQQQQIQPPAPAPKQPMSPNRGEFVSDNASNAGSINFQSLDALMADLGNLMVKDPGSGNQSANAEALRAEYDSKFQSLTKTVSSLEDKIQAEREQNNALQDRLEDLSQSNAELENALRTARDDYTRLDQDFRAQQRLAQEVQQEAERIVSQLKEARAENDQLRQMHERDQQLVRDLQARIRQLEEHGGHGPTTSANDAAAARGGVDVGAISEDKLNAFRDAVDGLIRSAGSDNRTDVLVAMKNIVFACKTITEDVEARESEPSSLSVHQREDLVACKTQLTAALTTLMAAAKAHATGAGGYNSASDLENAAENLSDIIYSIADLIGVRAGSATVGSGGQGDSTQSIGSNGLYASPPQSSQNNNANGQGQQQQQQQQQAMDLESLRGFLEQQTDAIVQAIQSLLNSMRTNSFDNEFLETVHQIHSVVYSLNSQCRASFNQYPVGSQGQAIRGPGYDILDKLLASNEELAQYADQIVRNPELKPSKQRLASASYEVAKFTKELVSLLEG